MKRILLLLCMLWALPLAATTWPAASCNTADVQTAIDSAAEGDTVTIPAGTCTWTSGVTISGKGITITGAGSGRIVAYSVLAAAYTIGTGTKTIAVTGYSPGFSSAVFTTGSTIKLFENANDTNTMTGTVSSFSSGTLTLNVTSSAGTCGNVASSNCKRWLLATVPSSLTAIINNGVATGGPLFAITEDTSVHTNIGNIQINAGTVSQNAITIAYASGGQAVLVHDMYITTNSNNPQPNSGNATQILGNSPWRGVVWNYSCETYPYSISSAGCISVQDKGNVTNSASWTTASKWGSADTTGQENFYAETNDYHGNGYATSTDDSGRAVFRYSLYDNAGVATHGADTSNYGQRYFEFYQNIGLFEGYNDGTTFNFQGWIYLRGGTAVVWGNTLPDVVSSDWGTKDNINMTVMNLQRNQGPDPCWGSGTHTAGQFYHAPRQVGFGYVTGTGTVYYPPLVTPANADDSFTYGGDSEPIYIWTNSTQPLDNVGLTDYGTTACTNPDSSVNYIISGRDYFNGSTAKPGYTPEVYPNPLVSGTPTVLAPTISPVTGTYTSPQTVSMSDSTSGANICFTLNGSTPTAPTAGTCGTGSTTYSTSFSQALPVTINALATKSGYTNSSVTTSVLTLSTMGCPQNQPVGSFTLCGEVYNDVASGTSVSATYSPAAGNGMVVWATWCYNSSCNSSTTGVTATISDNINSPETACTLSPHSPFITNANGGAQGSGDFQQHFVWYCPNIPSGVTSFTVTPSSASLSYLQINVSEWLTGTLAANCSPTNRCFELVDNSGAAGNTTGGTTATITTSGATTFATDLLFAVTETPCCSFTAAPGAGYTGITVAPTGTPGMISEAMATSTSGTKTATSSWTGGTTPWFGVLVPIKGIGAPVTGAPAGAIFIIGP